MRRRWAAMKAVHARPPSWTMAHRHAGHRRHPPVGSGFFSKDEILYRTFLESQAGSGRIGAPSPRGMTAFYMFAPDVHDVPGASTAAPRWGERGATGGGCQHEAPSDGRRGRRRTTTAGTATPGTARTSRRSSMTAAAACCWQSAPSWPASSACRPPWAGSNVDRALPRAELHVAGRGPRGRGGAPPVAHAVELGAHGPVRPARGRGHRLFAYRLYVQQPAEESERAGVRPSRAPHRVLTNKYYVDELYDATVGEAARWSGANGGCGRSTSNVVDGAVNGTGWTTIGRRRGSRTSSTSTSSTGS